MLAFLFTNKAKASAKQKERMEKDPDLSGKKAIKKKITKIIADLEIEFREKIESLREDFRNKLQEFSRENPTANKEKLVQFAYSIISVCSDKILEEMEKRELSKKQL